MKRAITIFLLGFVFTVSSCNKDEERTTILGSWNCEEITEIGGIVTYQISITRNHYAPNDSNSYLINNFHNIGNSPSLEVIVEEIEIGKLEIAHSPIGFDFEGNGTIASDFSKIDWQYKVNDGINNPLVISTYY